MTFNKTSVEDTIFLIHEIKVFPLPNLVYIRLLDGLVTDESPPVTK